MKDNQAGIIIGVAGLAFSAYLYFKLDKIATSVNMTVSELSTKTHIDIEQTLIDRAIQKAIERDVETAISDASRIAVRRISDDIKDEVRKEVNHAYTDLRQNVSDEIAKQSKNIDIDKLKREVVSKAKDAVLEKFDGELDGILTNFNNNLENVSTIYSSIANSMTKKQQKELIFMEVR